MTRKFSFKGSLTHLLRNLAWKYAANKVAIAAHPGAIAALVELVRTDAGQAEAAALGWTPLGDLAAIVLRRLAVDPRSLH